MSDAPTIMTDALDQYDPKAPVDGTARMDAAMVDAIATDLIKDGWLAPDAVDTFKQIMIDGFVNPLTGMGDPNRDKTLAGSSLGPQFVVTLISGPEAESLWRGSDLGARIVEQIPAEMCRKGWTINIQPEEGEFDGPQPKVDREGLIAKVKRTLWNLGIHRDEWPQQLAAPATPPHVPGPLPQKQNDGTSLVDRTVKDQRRLKVNKRVRTALRYRRGYGGGAVLMGIDDGGKLVDPVDETKIKAITHLTAFRGGWDGELIAWSWYNELGHPKFGQPRVYMLRNLGVPVASPPAPGEPATNPVYSPPSNPGPDFANPGPWGNLVTYVHESRLLVFGSQPETVSNRVSVQMRGWTDSVFTRVLEVLSQFNQTWSGVSILLSELSIPVQSIKGLSALMASKDNAGISAITARAIAQKMAMSIARMRLIDMDEKLERMEASLAGVGDVLNQYWLRLAAASGMPVSMLMGQVQGGLGDSSKGDVLFFYDQIAGMQEDELLPQLERLTYLQFCAKNGPTGGVVPKHWGITMNPLKEMDEAEEAGIEKTIAETDSIRIKDGVVTAEEVAAHRYGSDKFNRSPGIVLDIEARQLAKSNEEMLAARPPPALPAVSGGQTPPGAPPPPASAAAPAPGPQKAPPAATPVEDAADLVSWKGKTKVRSRASAIAAFNAEGKMLLGKRHNGTWCSPAGHAEIGESPDVCAVRELYEETGLWPQGLKKVGVKTIATGEGVVTISLFRALVEGTPTAANDPDQEFTGFEFVSVSPSEWEAWAASNTLAHPRDIAVEHATGG